MCTRAATHTTYNGAVTFSGQDMGGHGRHQGPRHQRHARRPTPPQTSRQLPYASMQQVYLQLHLLLAAGCLSRLLGTFLGPSLLLCVAAGLQGNAQQQQQSRQRVRHITCCPCMRASSTAMQLKLSPSALLLLSQSASSDCLPTALPAAPHHLPYTRGRLRMGVGGLGGGGPEQHMQPMHQVAMSGSSR